jgi:hypothetical protein
LLKLKRDYSKDTCKKLHKTDIITNSCLWLYVTMSLPLVQYGHETWPHTFREEHRLRVLENRVLRKISGTKRENIME